jgi:hypothetical protein
MPPPVDHVIVLALENRSFDHMLGFVPHDSPLFDGLTRGGPYTNPPWRGTGPPIPATPDAKPVLPVDPNHSHDAVMQQLRLEGQAGARRPTNQGFVASYEEKCRGLAPPTFGGLLGPLANWWFRHNAGANPVTDRGGLIMRCQPPSQVPVLATLALQFGVCSKWFASVPGETWPNRNFLHAATSDSTTDNEIRFYTDPTIFELLEDHGKTCGSTTTTRLRSGRSGVCGSQHDCRTGSRSRSSPAMSSRDSYPATPSSSPPPATRPHDVVGGRRPGPGQQPAPRQQPGRQRRLRRLRRDRRRRLRAGRAAGRRRLRGAAVQPQPSSNERSCWSPTTSTAASTTMCRHPWTCRAQAIRAAGAGLDRCWRSCCAGRRHGSTSPCWAHGSPPW